MTVALVALSVACGLLLVLSAYLAVRVRAAGGPRRAPGLGWSAAAGEVERARRRLEDVLDVVDEGVVVLNAALTPALANRAARRALGLGDGALPARLPSAEITAVARAATAGRATRDALVRGASGGELAARVTPLDDGVVVVVRDVADERAAQRMRREFVAHASHELKTPVAAMQTLAEAIERATGDDPEAAARFAGRLVAEAERLSRLVADLLDLSRLEEPSGPPPDDVDLAAVARAALDDVRAAAHAKDLDVALDAAPAVVLGDAAQLRLAARNLVDNAVRYTPRAGHVRVAVRVDGDDAVLRVSDDGAGIPLSAQARVFERFYRVDDARSRDRGGTGLGLAIVKHVVELHGGRVELDSELGRGSTFTVRLPLAPRPARQAVGT